ncbi:MAG TPA: hypothetical protein VH640_03665 [Bryobacteraceae bacterium]|jgi:hypothetical protein
MRLIPFAVLCWGSALLAQDAREIVRKSVELDQANWARRADYTWNEEDRERHFDSHNRVTAEHQEAWETLVLDGEPYRRMLQRDFKPLPEGEQKKEQQKLDRIAAKLDKESPQEGERRAAEREKERQRERKFLLEVPDAFHFHLDGEGKIDGQDAWVISATPRADYHLKSREGAAMLKVRGKIWIEKAGYEWVRLEAETTATISFGWFLARLNPGGKLVFEQIRVDDGLWLPRRAILGGSGRIGLVKRVAEEDEITWSNYRKFRVESKVVSAVP